MNDILVNSKTNDILVDGGDLVVGYSEAQHQKHILIAEKSEYKKFPELGVGIDKMLENELYEDMLLEAKRNLQYDGMTIKNISFTENESLNIDGGYK